MAGDLKQSERQAPLDAVVLNAQLMKSLVRQHELTEAAQTLNDELQTEIAARKRAEEALIRSEKIASVGRMAAVLAHEINNPLEAVTNLLYIAKSAEGVPEKVQSCLETADSELKRVAHITRQTLGFYRETAAPTTFYVVELLESIVDLLSAKVASSKATIDIQCRRDLKFKAFPGELRQVFSNFVRNSLDASSEAGFITLRASPCFFVHQERPAMRVTVSDNGHGIDAAALPSMFQPFFTTKGAIGNGLGLWVSRQIIEKHGGRIQVRSRTSGPRQGTTFSVVLPVIDE